jgi:DNA polymerase III sliding clamp (beta) subunit (PCNA family)
MKIDRQELLQQLQKLMSGVDSGFVLLEGSDSFIFTEDAIHSYNEIVSVSVPYLTELKGVVKAKEFYKLIEKLKTEEIEINVEGEHWHIISGNTNARLKLLETDILKYISQLKVSSLEWISLPDNFYEGIKLCKIANSSNNLRGFFIKDAYLVSTDRIRINTFRLNRELPQFWIDDLGITELLKLKEKMFYFAISDAWVHFKGENGSIFSCKRNADKEYPFDKLMEYKNLVQNEEPYLATVFPSNIKEAIDRISIMSDNIRGFEVVTLTLEKEKIKLFSKKDIGDITEIIELPTPFDKDIGLSIMADVSFLMEAIDKCPNIAIKKIKVDKTKNVLTFENEFFIQILSTITEG